MCPMYGSFTGLALEKAIIAIAYAAHRREAFAACEEAVERVKHEVPVWKEEFYMDGSSQYVEGCCIRKDELDHSSASQHTLQHPLHTIQQSEYEDHLYCHH